MNSCSEGSISNLASGTSCNSFGFHVGSVHAGFILRHLFKLQLVILG